jgi:type II secretory pathway predicted ATPase ExeA
MYEEFYGFREKPFSLNTDPNYLFKSRKHTKGLTMLEYGLASEASIVILTGEVGSGKTTLTRKLL